MTMKSRKRNLFAASRLALASLVFASFVFATPGGGKALAQDKQVIVGTTGGSFLDGLQKHYFEPFTKATGIKVVTSVADVGELWTKVRAMNRVNKVEWDVVFARPNHLISEVDNIERLDCAKIPNAAAFGVEGACGTGLLRYIGGGVLAYSLKAFPAGGPQPKTWGDFWDFKKFPGPRSLQEPGGDGWNYMIALMADGVAKDKLFPLDLDRATKKLEELKPHVPAWWRSGDQSQQIIRDGEVVMELMWSNRALTLVRQGVPVGVSWDGAIQDPTYWAILKNAPDRENAYALLNDMMGNIQGHVGFFREIVADSSNKKAIESYSEAEKRDSALNPVNFNAMAVPDFAYVAKNTDMMRRRFEDFLTR
jgi:mannopine transport system substrate-binding protein